MTDLKQFAKTAAKYRHDYDLTSKLEPLVQGEAAAVASALWQAQRENMLDLSSSNQFWSALHLAPEAYSAEEALMLCRAIGENYPEGILSDGSVDHYLWSEESLPGYMDEIQRVLAAKKDDPHAVTVFLGGWQDLPEPLRGAVGYQLAQLELLSHEALPGSLLSTAAEVHVRHGEADHQPWRRPGVWPEPIWGPALLEAALAPEVSFARPGVLKELLPHAGADQLLHLARALNCNTDLMEGIHLFSGISEDTLDAVESTFETLEVKPSPQDWDEPWPAYNQILVYLLGCQEQRRVPAPALDRPLGELLSGWQEAFSGDGFEAYHQALRDLLAVVPAARMEPLMLATTEVKWPLIGACPTEAVARAAVAAVVAKEKLDSYGAREFLAVVAGPDEGHGKGGLVNLGPAAVPAIAEALVGKPCPHRLALVQALVTIGAESPRQDDLQALTHCLGDSSRAVRELAHQGLSMRDPRRVLEAITPLTTARKKPLRLGAATLLAQLKEPRVVEVAQAALKQEKDAKIRELLQGIEAPAVEASASDPVLEALRSSEGAAWTHHVDLGAPLLEIFWDFLLQSKTEESFWLSDGELDAFQALLKTFAQEPLAAELAVRALPLMEYHGDQWLAFITQTFDADVARRVGQLIAGDSYRRPRQLGDRPLYSVADCLSWFEEHEPRQAVVVMVATLGHRTSRERKRASEGLTRLSGLRPEAVVAGLLPALAAEPTDRAIEAAKLLGALGAAEALQPIDDLLAGKPRPKLAAALKQARAAITSGVFEVATYEPTEQGNNELSRALASLPLPAAVDGKLLARLQKQTLRFSAGGVLGDEARRWFVAQLMQESLERSSPALWAVRARLRHDDCAALLAPIQQTGCDSGWSVFAVGLLGGLADLQALGGQLGQLASSSRTHWGSEGVVALERNGSDTAVLVLEQASRSRRQALRHRAAEALERLARQRDLTVEDLVELALGDLGFDEDGVQRVSYGPRQFTLRLAEHNALVIEDEAGKALKSMPRPRVSDDSEVAARSKAMVSTIRKQLKQLRRPQVQRLERAMCTARPWPVAAWRARLLTNPLMRGHCRSLLWEHEQAHGRQLFVVSPEGVPVDLDQAPLPLAEDGVVRILHPATLTPQALQGLRSQPLKLAPPFPQLGRRTFYPSDLPQDDLFFTSFERVGSAHFVRMLAALGYERGDREGAGLINASHATRGPYQVTLGHEPFSPELLTSDPELEVTGVTVSTEAGELLWRQLPQPFFSELALDVHRLMGPPRNPELREERCRVVAADKSEREAATLEVLWHEELGGQLHFVGRFSDGVYCASTLVQGNSIWFEGDRDGTLACLPPELFELALPGVAPSAPV